MKKLLPLALLPLVLFACKKDKDENINTTPTPEAKVIAMPLAVGNYWVYQKYNIDTNGVETTFGGLDSVYISSKQVAHGDTFFKLKGGTIFSFPDDILLRDSIGYLVDPAGYIFFAQNNYTDTLRAETNLNSGLNDLYEYMAYKDSIVTVPAGTYTKTGTLLSVWIFIPQGYPWGPRRDAFRTFADNVGMVKRRAFYTNPPDYIEARLVRYHVN